MHAKTAGKIRQVQLQVANGTPVEKALKRVKLSGQTYYKHRNAVEKLPAVINERPDVIVPPAHLEEQVTITMVKCSLSTAAKILGGAR